ncbi:MULTISPECIES: Ref family recombination enhancement nuclease [Pseudomonas]|uniref:Recombination enhancement, RecA-dependent nuclease n=1 Tax=Pseudomonas lutea TaxID=243924 RepID=A0A9X8MH62_9PSED|nr:MULTISPECIES: Ref family recombination enhancement nuclease [Pseudomonas]SER37329.1 Recombination enhancement, RecA-dependent nuclease [Pseudomonas lutea]
MKGTTPTASQKRYHDSLASHVGCIACRHDYDEFNGYVSIHHMDGRTKPDAHYLVLPLCAGHHQDGYGQPGMIAVHPYKARFESRYGKQIRLLAECVNRLAEQGIDVPPRVRELTGLHECAPT